MGNSTPTPAPPPPPKEEPKKEDVGLKKALGPALNQWKSKVSSIEDGELPPLEIKVEGEKEARVWSPDLVKFALSKETITESIDLLSNELFCKALSPDAGLFLVEEQEGVFCLTKGGDGPEQTSVGYAHKIEALVSLLLSDQFIQNDSPAFHGLKYLASFFPVRHKLPNYLKNCTGMLSPAEFRPLVRYEETRNPSKQFPHKMLTKEGEKIIYEYTSGTNWSCSRLNLSLAIDVIQGEYVLKTSPTRLVINIITTTTTIITTATLKTTKITTITTMITRT